MSKVKVSGFIAIILIAVSCQPSTVKVGSIERIDPTLDEIISPDAFVEKIAEGFDWSEGPVWVESQKMLLFTDVPKNIIYQWTEQEGAKVYLTPSGFTGSGFGSGESGANGLILDDEGNLLLCQHGDRRVAIMNASLESPQPDYSTIAGDYKGKKLNSPNDLVWNNYNIYFTDPPYGLAADSLREIPYQGVYRAPAEGEVELLIDSLTRPNGIAFSPDSKKMFVANSDKEKARWYVYEMSDSATVLHGKVFFDATAEAQIEKGLPDGMKIDSKGNIFATGPGGVWIFNLTGKLLGKIKLPEATANCALSADEKTLYLTSDMYLLRIKMK